MTTNTRWTDERIDAEAELWNTPPPSSMNSSEAQARIDAEAEQAAIERAESLPAWIRSLCRPAEAEQAAIERAESVDALKAKHIPGWLPMTPEEKAALGNK